MAPTQALWATPASASSVRAAGSGDAVLDIVILVDESGSETAASVADERQTAATIGQTLLNPHSRVTVIGFGGVNHVTPNQDPTNVACQPTVASGAANLSYLATCVNGLHRRTAAQGNDTDYAAALGQAMSYFNPATAYGRQSPAGAIKVILMMTDGGLDVHNNTQQYGANWLAGAHHAVNLQLATARAADVQVWPLGFGTITPANQQYLHYLAANGAQTACDNRHASKPHATIVNNPAAVPSALEALYAAAGCLVPSQSSVILHGNQTRWLQVSIPDIASDAAISVYRRNPGVQVAFYQPDGTIWSDGSALSGTGTPVETLHVGTPQAGTWRIKLTAPPGLASELVTATTFWQGAVDAIMTASPSSALPGQRIDVTLSVLGARGPISDPATLARMRVTVSVSGDGLSKPALIPVSNAGEANGTTTGVGDYRGTFTAPRAHGSLTFTGSAAGYGLYATEVPASVQIGSGTRPFQSTVRLPLASTVLVGQSLHGEILFANKTGVTHMVRLSLRVSHAHAAITSPAGAIRVPSGNPPSVPFTITFAKNSPTGQAWLEVKVVDGAEPRTSYGAATLEITVRQPPSLLFTYRWEIAAAVFLIALLVLILLRRRRARREAADVRGLVAIIRRNGEQVGVELKAPGKYSDKFRFVIRDEDTQAAQLNFPQPDDPVYVARRGRTGQVDVVTPSGEEYEIATSGRGEPLLSGLQLAFRDTRRASQGRRSGGSKNARVARTPRPDPSPNPSPDGNGAPPPPPQPSGPAEEAAPSPPDVWLN